jgi:hypothetical protein
MIKKNQESITEDDDIKKVIGKYFSYILNEKCTKALLKSIEVDVFSNKKVIVNDFI